MVFKHVTTYQSLKHVNINMLPYLEKGSLQM